MALQQEHPEQARSEAEYHPPDRRRFGKRVAIFLPLVAAVAALLVVPTNEFKYLFAGHYGGQVGTPTEVDNFVEKLSANQDLPVWIKRVLGRRLELDVSFPRASGEFKLNDDVDVRDPRLNGSEPGYGFRLTTTKCPLSEGQPMPIYVYLRGEVDNGLYSWANGDQVTLYGFWDVDKIIPVPDRSFCYVDLRTPPT